MGLMENKHQPRGKALPPEFVE